MPRRLVFALAALALLPASAQAAKLPLGTGIAAAPKVDTAEKPAATGSIFADKPAKPKKEKADAGPGRIPFPPSATPAPAPVLMKITTTDQSKSWCRSEVVVGGFCVLN